MQKTITMLDRLELAGVLPQKGSYEKLVVARDVEQKIKITQDDILKYGIIFIDSKVQWQIPKGEQDAFTYEFTNLENKVIREELEALEKKGDLPKNFVHLYEVFVLATEEKQVEENKEVPTNT